MLGAALAAFQWLGVVAVVSGRTGIDPPEVIESVSRRGDLYSALTWALPVLAAVLLRFPERRRRIQLGSSVLPNLVDALLNQPSNRFFSRLFFSFLFSIALMLLIALL